VSDIPEEIKRARVVFWTCLIREHRDRRSPEGTVEWVDGVAHCTAPGCELTSEHTARFRDTVAEVLLERINKECGHAHESPWHTSHQA
jgi:hypothetical protein